MPRSRIKRHRGAVALLALLALLLVMPGSAAAQEPGAEDTAPIIFGTSVTPTSLPHEGGPVTITVDAIDDFGITMAYADVFMSGGSGESVLLIASAIDPSGVTTYSGIAYIPPNDTGEPVSYGVVVQVTDTNGAIDSEVAGEIQVDAQPQFDEAPAAFDPSVQPRGLASAGGAVTIAVSASDDRALSEVYASVTLPGGATAHVPLEGTSSSRFQGVFTAPPNTATTAARYAIEAVALDDIGQSGSVDAGHITVAAKPPGAGGSLAISPASRYFGQVQVGRWVRQSFTLRNLAPRSMAPVSGVIVAPRAPFALPGARPPGIPFSLRGGDAKVYAVDYRPASVGIHAGTVAIRRDDGAQPGLAVRLVGQGVARSPLARGPDPPAPGRAQ